MITLFFCFYLESNPKQFPEFPKCFIDHERSWTGEYRRHLVMGTQNGHAMAREVGGGGLVRPRIALKRKALNN